jgi:hypocretin (orexin) receptor 2
VFVVAALSASRRNTLNTNANITTEGQLRSRRKAAKMLVAVVIMFAVCYFPVHVLSILRYVEGTRPCGDVHEPR